MGQKVTGNLKLDVQGTGVDRSNTWAQRDTNISDLSSTANLAQRRRITTTTLGTVVFTPPIATATLVHLKASSPFNALVNGKTITAAQIFIEKAGITSLRLGKKAGGDSVTVDILIIGK